MCINLQTLEEIAELEQDIRRLEEDLRKKMWDLKLAHTRLETRTYRPNVELCRDQVQMSLQKWDILKAIQEGWMWALKPRWN